MPYTIYIKSYIYSRMRRKTQKRKRAGRKSRKQLGGDTLPNTGSLSLEFIFNDFLYGRYKSYFIEEASLNEIERATNDGKKYVELLNEFIKNIKETNGIPYYKKEIQSDRLREYLVDNIKEDDNLCKGKIDLGKIYATFNSSHPSVCILLKHNSSIIGIGVITFTNRHITQHFSNRLNMAKLYIHIDWLCGSKYNKVGSIIIETIEKIQQYMGADSIFLISYDSAIPFYKKMGFEYLGQSRMNTPMMEKKSSKSL